MQVCGFKRCVPPHVAQHLSFSETLPCLSPTVLKTGFLTNPSSLSLLRYGRDNAPHRDELSSLYLGITINHSRTEADIEALRQGPVISRADQHNLKVEEVLRATAEVLIAGIDI
ncbi:unnamed protein product [Ceratitis capitata]|uniref:(Mediterranean fruit fly) hypothetical protein n=1 Tax=Ceratitis capitata TaxID=7213 RepID=A0A811UUF3_CERCA|nr:unnamed protein product [Ceratitis capitata]